MLKKRFKIKLYRLIALTVALSTLFMFSATAQDIQENDAWKEKISSELWEVMAEKSDNDLIPVYLWLKDIDQKVITNALIQEKGMNPAIYEDQKRFEEEIVPQIEAEIVARVGYEEAHYVEPPKQLETADELVKTGEVVAAESKEAIDDVNQQSVKAAKDEVLLDRNISLVDRAVSGKVNEYMMAKREITKREYSAVNDKFIKNNVESKQRKVLYNSKYTSTLVVEATKAEIKEYALMDLVEEISLYVELVQEPALNISLGQVGADSSTGTKSSLFNSGYGYRGTGVKIGIIEAGGGRFDSNASQLRTISKSRLIYSNDAGENGNPIEDEISDHATMVTSIIVGQSVTVNGRTYEGIVPLATVYQTPIIYSSDVLRAIQKLADKGVTVINYSGGSDRGPVYDNYDKEVDRLIANTGVTFVNSAGNTSDNITSPGKALNAITVGNAATKSSSTTANSSPYNMSGSSSYKEADYLPNKPDITAPGTNISYVKSEGTIQTKSGTSFAAPHVTDVVAQMMQVNPALKTSPTLVKSNLLLGARSDQITTINNPTADNSYLREKSGAGLVNAINAVNAAFSYNSATFYINSLMPKTLLNQFIYAGQKIRIVMAFDKVHTGYINSENDLDNIDILILDSKTALYVTASISLRNNVEIIEYTFTKSSFYSIRVSPGRIIDTSKYLHASVSWELT